MDDDDAELALTVSQEYARWQPCRGLAWLAGVVAGVTIWLALV